MSKQNIFSKIRLKNLKNQQFLNSVTLILKDINTFTWYANYYSFVNSKEEGSVLTSLQYKKIEISAIN